MFRWVLAIARFLCGCGVALCALIHVGWATMGVGPLAERSLAVVVLVAAWPHLSGRAPYSFWLVAMGVWLGGGVLAFILLEILHGLGLVRP